MCKQAAEWYKHEESQSNELAEKFGQEFDIGDTIPIDDNVCECASYTIGERRCDCGNRRIGISHEYGFFTFDGY